LPRVGTAEILAPYAVQPARSALPEKHCAAQAEYGRLAAQAYSPSDAMSQARFCLGGMKKVQRRPRRFAGQFTAMAKCGSRSARSEGKSRQRLRLRTAGAYSWRVG